MASNAYRFDFNLGSPDYQSIVASGGGPGLGWEFALTDAVRQYCLRRGDVGGRWITCEVEDELPMTQCARGTVAHVRVRTSRHVDPVPAYRSLRAWAGAPDLLDVRVRRVGRSETEEEVDGNAATA